MGKVSLKGKVCKDGRLIVLLQERLAPGTTVDVEVDIPASQEQKRLMLVALEKSFGTIPDLDRPDSA